MPTALAHKLFRRLGRVHRLTQQGFTLLELLVAVLIGSIITSALLFLVVEMLQVNNREESLTQTQQNMRRAIDFMTRDLSEAVFVYSEFTSGSSYDLLAQLDGEPAGTPVLAFWRLDPLSDAEVTALNTFCDAQTGDAADECETLLVRQATYTLVVYFHQENAANDIWEGQSRIIRYQLPAYQEISTTALTRNQGYADPTLPIPGTSPAEFNSFGNWQKGNAGSNASSSSEYVFTDYVNIVDTTATTACPTLPADANASYVRIPANDDSFYTCITQADGGGANNQNVNKSVILYLQGNASRRDPDRVIGISEASSLPRLESQVLIRGTIQNQPL